MKMKITLSFAFSSLSFPGGVIIFSAKIPLTQQMQQPLWHAPILLPMKVYRTQQTLETRALLASDGGAELPLQIKL